MNNEDTASIKPFTKAKQKKEKKGLTDDSMFLNSKL